MTTSTIRLLSLLTLFTFPAFSGTTTAQINYEKADSIALNFDEEFETLAELAGLLTAELSTDLEKARVLFMWIADNVRYDCKKYHERNPPANEDLKTAKRKRGICGDYSNLYRALCDEVGLQSVVIVGNARDAHRPNRKAHDNPHGWNAVKIDGNWQLVDATWGAGYTDDKVTKFRRRLAPGYFCPPPDQFAQDHFPDEEYWQLLEPPLSKAAFPKQPMINYGQVEFRIIGFSPQVEEIDGEQKMNQVWLRFAQVPRIISVTNNKGKPIEFDKKVNGDKVILTFSGSRNRVNIFGGNSNGRSMNWLARYKSDN